MADKLTTSQAAKLLGVHPDTMRTWRRRGGGPPFHIDPSTADNAPRRLIHYTEADIVAYKEKQDG